MIMAWPEHGQGLTVRGGCVLDRVHGRFRLICIERLAAERQIGGVMAVGEEAVVTDAVEPFRQGTQQKAADELVCVQVHDLGFAMVGIDLPAEGASPSVTLTSRESAIATLCI